MSLSGWSRSTNELCSPHNCSDITLSNVDFFVATEVTVIYANFFSLGKRSRIFLLLFISHFVLPIKFLALLFSNYKTVRIAAFYFALAPYIIIFTLMRQYSFWIMHPTFKMLFKKEIKAHKFCCFIWCFETIFYSTLHCYKLSQRNFVKPFSRRLQ